MHSLTSRPPRHLLHVSPCRLYAFSKRWVHRGIGGEAMIDYSGVYTYDFVGCPGEQIDIPPKATNSISSASYGEVPSLVT